MDSCVFCSIVAGEIPCHRVWEDEGHLAFLDIRPMREGHALVVPKAHAPELFEMDDEAYLRLMGAAKAVAAMLKPAFGVPRVGAAVEGFQVDHVHVHVIPLERGLEAADFTPGMRPEPDHAALAATLDRIRAA
jgi:histidine triad (HIT) family protein